MSAAFELLFLRVARLGRDQQGNECAFRERQLEPAGAEGVAIRNLPTTLFHRMRHVIAPFRGWVIGALVCKNTQAPIRGRFKSKTNRGWLLLGCAVLQGAGVR